MREHKIVIQQSSIGRPRKPDSERRSMRFLLRLSPKERAKLMRASHGRQETIADILRKGALLYLKDGRSRRHRS